MKLIHLIIILIIACLYITENICMVQKAVINVPIADLIGQQIRTIRPDEPIERAYNTIAFCAGQTTNAYACPRLHQVLYNDIVEIVKTTDDEVCIRIAHAYYLIPSSNVPQSQYWTLKKNITLIDDLIARNIPIHHVPAPLHFSHTKSSVLNQTPIVTLTEPYYDSTLRTTFSAGTRFVAVQTSAKKRASYRLVFAIDYTTLKEYQIKIPRQKCIISDDTQTPQDRITHYVKLLQQWSHTKQGCIPYTWGGTSFTHTTQGNFKEVTRTNNNSDYTLYEYEKNTQSPKSGFDCSGLILRAAQISGIPYFCKNTATIPHCLTPLQQGQTLSAGDLILIRGHVMVVSDIAKNLLIEARAYGQGYGKLHEIPLHQVFEGIENYNDLIDAFFNKTIIKRKDNQGKVRDTFANLQLFPLISIWK